MIDILGLHDAAIDLVTTGHVIATATGAGAGARGYQGDEDLDGSHGTLFFKGRTKFGRLVLTRT